MKQEKKLLLCVVLFLIIISLRSFAQEEYNSTDEALLKAVHEGKTATVMALIDAGANVNVLVDGRSALHEAVLYAPISTINVLLKAGASIDLEDKSGFTPLYLAASKLRLDVIELLLNIGAKKYSGVISAVIDGFNYFYFGRLGYKRIIDRLSPFFMSHFHLSKYFIF